MRTRSLVLSIVLALVPAAPASATYPGRNGLIAVVGNSDSPGKTIWVGHRDGIDLHSLPSPCPPGPPDPPWDSCNVGAPAWSPDGRRLVFYVHRGLDDQLWIVNADGSDLHQVPGVRGVVAAWSPDGTRLVFDSNSLNPFDCHYRDVYTVNADGTGLKLLTRQAANPDWSVRGQIVFDRQHEHWTEGPESECWPTSTLAVMQPGGQARGLGKGSGARWAPGGRSIAYFGGRGIVRKRLGAPGPGRLLLKGGAYDFNWSPDGRFILYRKQLRLRMIDARTGRPRPLALDAPGIDFSAAWQPLPR
jgi:WD40-like Beta Propeller Repeat